MPDASAPRTDTDERENAVKPAGEKPGPATADSAATPSAQKKPALNIRKRSFESAPPVDEMRAVKETPPRWPPMDESDLPDLRKKPLKLQILEKGVEIAGFGSVMRAWRAEGNTFRNVMKSLGAKTADMLAGRMVSMSFRLFTITWVAGMIGGVSTWGALGLLAAATGAASSIYTYHKEYIGDKLKARKRKDMKVKFFDRGRAKKSLLAFAGGFAGGGFGLWLAKTEIFQNFIGAIKDMFSPATDAVTDTFNKIADAPAKPAADAQFATAAAPRLTSQFSVATNPEARIDAAQPVPATIVRPATYPSQFRAPMLKAA